jgi:hypothetical protein
MISAEERAPILAEVKKLAIRKHGLLTDDEFRSIVGAASAATI